MTTRPLIGGGPLGAGPTGTYFEGEFTNAPSAPNVLRPTAITNGQSPGHVANLVGFAGAAILFAGTVFNTTPVTQPTPSEPSLSLAGRVLDQPGTSITKASPALFAAPVQPASKYVSTVGQENVNLSPQISKTFIPPLLEVPQRPHKASLEQSVEQFQPKFNKTFFAPSVVVSNVLSTKNVENLQTPTPVFNKYFFAPAAPQNPIIGFKFATQQQSTEQRAPQVWYYKTDVARLGAGNYSSFPLQSVEQHQPKFAKYVFPPVVVENPPLKPHWLAKGQEDLTQVQPNWNRNPPESVTVVQPTPVAAALGVAPRHLDQPAPWKAKYPFTPVAVQDTPLRPHKFVADLQPTYQPAPSFNKLVPETAKLPPNVFGSIPAQVQEQVQPSFKKSYGVFFSAQTYVINPTGGITFSGDVFLQHTRVVETSGGLSFTGAATRQTIDVMEPSGSITFGGTATMFFVPAGSVVITTRLPMTGAGVT